MTDPKERPEAMSDTGTAAGHGSESGDDQKNHPLSDAETQGVVGGTSGQNPRHLPSGATVNPMDVGIDPTLLNPSPGSSGSGE